MRPSRSGGSVAFVVATAPLVPPAAPTLSIDDAFGHPRVLMSAIDPVAVTRKIYANYGGGGYNLVATISAVLTFWIDFTWASPGATNLLYKVTDENTAGVSAYSNVVNDTGD